MTYNFSAFKWLSARDQLRTLKKLQEHNTQGLDALSRHSGIGPIHAAQTLKEKVDAFDQIPPATAKILEGLIDQRASIKDLPFYLYNESPHASVRKKMAGAVDEFIEKRFYKPRLSGPVATPTDEGQNDTRILEAHAIHGLLFLFSFGADLGLVNLDPPEVGYIFNVTDTFNNTPTMPLHVREYLQLYGLVPSPTAEVDGDSLTEKGKAVLTRLNERFDLPEFVKPFTNEAKKIEISCSHHTDGVPIEQRVDDYYPLSWQELKSLVTLAFNDAAKKTAIHCRLDQAIPGQVCPREIRSPQEQTANELSDVYYDGLENSDPDTLTHKIASILEIRPS